MGTSRKLHGLSSCNTFSFLAQWYGLNTAIYKQSSPLNPGQPSTSGPPVLCNRCEVECIQSSSLWLSFAFILSSLSPHFLVVNSWVWGCCWVPFSHPIVYSLHVQTGLLGGLASVGFTLLRILSIKMLQTYWYILDNYFQLASLILNTRIGTYKLLKTTSRTKMWGLLKRVRRYHQLWEWSLESYQHYILQKFFFGHLFPTRFPHEEGESMKGRQWKTGGLSS